MASPLVTGYQERIISVYTTAMSQIVLGAETAFSQTVTIDGGTLAAGDVIRLYWGGWHTNDATATTVIARVRAATVSGTVLAQTNATTITVSVASYISFFSEWVVRTGGSSGILVPGRCAVHTGAPAAATVGAGNLVAVPAAVDLTANLILVPTVTPSTAQTLGLIPQYLMVGIAKMNY